ncbi:MAG: hypothetical protein LBP72_05735 [Dysgonamonadaceae bacterium]|jgi:hypothetical protein|nr:hypothetical protein [Dysgonamonadaceae bacterium]
MATKIQKVSQTITSFAGVSFTNNEFNRCGLSQFIDNELSIRTLTNYQYSDIIGSWFDIFFCGGDVAEDIEQHFLHSPKTVYLPVYLCDRQMGASGATANPQTLYRTSLRTPYLV